MSSTLRLRRPEFKDSAASFRSFGDFSRVLSLALLLCGALPLTGSPAAAARAEGKAASGTSATKSESGHAATPSERDKARIVEMIRAARDGKWRRARDLANASGPFAQSLYLWMYHSDEDNPVIFSTAAKFLSGHPDWPGADSLRRRAELEMPDGIKDSAVLSFFSGGAPATARGLSRYLDALGDVGKAQKAKETLVAWWRRTPATAEEQGALLDRYGKILTREDHRVRLDRLVSLRSYTAARALARRMGAGWPDLIEARISLIEERPDVNARLARVPGALRSDSGLLLDRVRWRRGRDDDDGAAALLRGQPAVAKIVDVQGWWDERQTIVRRLMEKGRYRSAYALVTDYAQPKDTNAAAEAQWLAGWIAWKFLNRPAEALGRFSAMHDGVNSPISRARAAYWSGRAAQALGKKDDAAQWLRRAASWPTTFYGQIAGAGFSAASLPKPVGVPAPKMEQKVAFSRKDMVRAARLFDAAGRKAEAAGFLQGLADGARTPEDYALAADLALDMGYLNDAVKISRQAARKGVVLSEAGYPTMLRRMKGVDLEWALVHALIRQESGFDAQAVSPAGARGLMQLMPSTAKEVAKKAGLRHDVRWLTAQPAHNIELGTRYFKRLLDKYDGSYALALAAYNGGPGRVDRWLEEIGDPRTGKIDIIDWIENIPVYETRNYVQRVLEGVYIYRLKLGDLQKTAIPPLPVSGLSVAARE